MSSALRRAKPVAPRTSPPDVDPCNGSEAEADPRQPGEYGHYGNAGRVLRGWMVELVRVNSRARNRGRQVRFLSVAPMNIFVLDSDPVCAAQHLGDGHVPKMVLETAQIACAVLHRYGVCAPYRSTHANHPCVRWAGASAQNWLWLRQYATELRREYYLRFGRHHASAEVIGFILNCGGVVFDTHRQTPFAQAMPESCRADDAVHAYRRYYAAHKRRGKDGRPLATWERSTTPAWWPEYAATYSEVV